MASAMDDATACTEEKEDDAVMSAPATTNLEAKQDWPWRKAKKCAVMLSFCGKNYMGMQR